MTDVDETTERRPGISKVAALRWLLILALVAMQWPMLKGLYYKNFKSEEKQEHSAVNWRASFEQAKTEAIRTGKPILLDFSASWCPPCLVMKNEVWNQAEVGQAVENSVIPLLVDVDVAENRPLAARYQVESIPSIIVITPEGEVLKQKGYMDAEDLVAMLENVSRARPSSR